MVDGLLVSQLSFQLAEIRLQTRFGSTDLGIDADALAGHCLIRREF